MKKILIIDYYYENYLETVQKELKPGFTLKDYTELKLSKNFSAANFYARSLRKLGFDAETFPANDLLFHNLWLKENKHTGSGLFLKFINNIPYFRYKYRKKWHQEVVKKKIIQTKPDVLFIQSTSFFPGVFFEGLDKYCKSIIAHISSPMPPKDHFDPYKLIISSFPHYIDTFNAMGKNTMFLPLAFDQTILSELGKQERDIDVSFVGSFFKVHDQENQLLESLAERVELDVWGHGLENLKPNSPILNKYHGEAWGNDMYKVLGKSKITINRHSSEVAKNFANNMRLFEATGMGSLLITDLKDNLHELFEIDKEIVAYKDLEELTTKVNYYLSHPEEREGIAKAGQERTLRDHTYDIRMTALINELKRLQLI